MNRLLLVLLLFTATALSAQDTVVVIQDSIPVKVRRQWDPIKVRGLRIGFDLLDPIFAYYDRNTQFQGQAELVINNRYFLVGEYGYQDYTVTARSTVDIDPESGEGALDYQYNTNGSFWRAGADFNLLHRSTKLDAVTIGMRYAQSNFSDRLIYNTENLYWQDPVLGESYINDELSPRENLEAKWLEVVVGLKVHVWNNFYLQSIGRLKILQDLSQPGPYTVSNSPGFGTMREQTVTRLNEADEEFQTREVSHRAEQWQL